MGSLNGSSFEQPPICPQQNILISWGHNESDVQVPTGEQK